MHIASFWTSISYESTMDNSTASVVDTLLPELLYKP